jgi:hypothetical protein
MIAVALGDEPGGVLEKDRRIGAAPLRVRRREMHPDVALADARQQRVGEGMQGRVGIGMTRQAPVVGDTHPAQRHMIAGREGMNVEALADANVAERQQRLAPQPLVGGRHILGACHLGVVGRARDQRHVDAGPFGNRGIVAEACFRRLAGAPMGPRNRIEAEALRRLDRPQAGAVHRLHHQLPLARLTCR